MYEICNSESQTSENEVRKLDIWLKQNKQQVTGDWLKRVCGVRDLLLFHGSFLSRKLGRGGGESESMEDKTKWRL